jgi:glycosyltransferase involved in cell wall biosynthesis
VNDPGDTTDDSTVYLSVVIPVYNAAECLHELYERLTAVLEGMCPDYEIILVDDASPDDSWNAMQGLHARDPRVKIIQQMRNFGQHKAILCGMQYAR